MALPDEVAVAGVLHRDAGASNEGLRIEKPDALAVPGAGRAPGDSGRHDLASIAVEMGRAPRGPPAPRESGMSG